MRYLRAFRYLEAVARIGSIRRAADALYITPSSLDRQIQSMEAAFETTLFERQARGMVPTAAGEILLAFVRRQLADMERVQSQISGLHALQHGHVRIVASQAVAMDCLPRAITDFRRRYPGITFSVRVATRHQAAQAVIGYEVDLALVVSLPREPHLDTLAATDEPVRALTASTHPLVSTDGVRLSDCLTYPLVLPDGSLGTRELIDRVMGERYRYATIAAETNSFELMRGLLVNGDAIGFQVAIGTPARDTSSELVALPLRGGDAITASLVCAQRRGRHLSVAAARFANHLSEWLEGNS